MVTLKNKITSKEIKDLNGRTQTIQLLEDELHDIGLGNNFLEVKWSCSVVSDSSQAHGL